MTEEGAQQGKRRFRRRNQPAEGASPAPASTDEAQSPTAETKTTETTAAEGEAKAEAAPVEEKPEDKTKTYDEYIKEMAQKKKPFFPKAAAEQPTEESKEEKPKKEKKEKKEKKTKQEQPLEQKPKTQSLVSFLRDAQDEKKGKTAGDQAVEDSRKTKGKRPFRVPNIKNAEDFPSLQTVGKQQ